MLNILLKTDNLLIAQSYAYGEHYAKDKNDYGFNLALHVNDNAERVLKNRATFLTLLNKQSNNSIKTLLWLNQIHGNDVYQVGDTLPIAPPNADAMMTDKAGVGLCIMTADCVPIVLFVKDEQGNIGQIANIHAGWQGLVKGIVVDAYQKFAKKMPIYAYVGVCISGGCYEIPVAMANDILNKCQAQFNLSADDIKATMTIKNDEKVLFSVGELAKLQLQSLGVTVLNDKIECTYMGNYFSHRKATHENKANTGRMAMVVVKL